MGGRRGREKGGRWEKRHEMGPDVRRRDGESRGGAGKMGLVAACGGAGAARGRVGLCGGRNRRGRSGGTDATRVAPGPVGGGAVVAGIQGHTKDCEAL